MSKTNLTEPVFELYPDVEEGLRALEAYAALIEQLSVSPEPALTIREAIASLKDDPSSSVMFGLDPAPDGLRRIVVVGSAARDHDAIRRSLQAMMGLSEHSPRPSNMLH